MNTQKVGFGQIVFQTLHVDERHDFLSVFQVKPYIVFLPFHIQDVVKLYALQLVIALYKNEG